MTRKNQQRILLIEDDPPLARVYQEYLKSEPYRITHVETGREGLRAIRKSPPDGIILDLHLPDMDGLEILKTIQEQAIPTSVVVITANGSINTAVEAMRLGAADFVLKPFNADRLVFTLRHALERRQLEQIVEAFKDDLDRQEYCGFIGSSLAMQAVYRVIGRAATSKATVFITGDSGTGKEVAAEAFHYQSSRKDKPFIALNCGAIPKDLIESEIFGHVKGAFTGAVAAREGAAALADGGTLFLDEICEMDVDLQVKLLRFLQTGSFQKVGSSETEKVDLRVIAATNRNPWEEVEAGRFREDLYYRLHVIPVHLPPLADRDGDVIEIAEHFLRQFSAEEGKDFQSFSAEAVALLSDYDWPGNVRQVQNVVRNIVVLNDGGVVGTEMFPEPLKSWSGDVQEPAKLQQGPISPRLMADFLNEKESPAAGNTAPASGFPIRPMWQVEREMIEEAIRACGGNVPRAAALLELSPSTVYRRLRDFEDSVSETLAQATG